MRRAREDRRLSVGRLVILERDFRPAGGKQSRAARNYRKWFFSDRRALENDTRLAAENFWNSRRIIKVGNFGFRRFRSRRRRRNDLASETGKDEARAVIPRGNTRIT